MANTFSAQGSITVRRLRTGDTLAISFDTHGVNLYQGVDLLGEVSPSWGTDNGDTTPLITPVVTSARSNAVTLSNHAWNYNGLSLDFSGTTITYKEVTYTLASNDARFGMASDGTLIIVGDLASETNNAADTLTYTCTATVAGVEYQLTKSIDITIQTVGSGTYWGGILVSGGHNVLDANNTTATLTATLYLVGREADDFYVVWYKDGELLTDKVGLSALSVSRDDVDGEQLYIARFFVSQTAYENGDAAVASAGVRITDSLDDYKVQHRYVNAAGTQTGTIYREVAALQSVYVQAYIVNTRTNTELTDITGNWTSYIMDKDTWQSLATIAGTGATNLVEITTTYTDVDGYEKDVEVVSEVSWEM